MAAKSLIFNVAILIFGIVTESYAQYWQQGYNYRQTYQQPYQQIPAGRQRNNYQTQSGYQDNPWLPQGVSIQDADWVCKNSKTGDMMIISSEDGPVPNPTPNVLPTPLPGNSNNPNEGQQPYLIPTPTQSTNDQVNLNKAIMQNLSNGSGTQPTLKQPQPSEDSSNINGEGLIDIRLGPD